MADHLHGENQMADHNPPCSQLERTINLVDALRTDAIPAINTRLTLVEDAVERFGKNSSKLVWIGMGILATLIINALTGHIVFR